MTKKINKPAAAKPAAVKPAAADNANLAASIATEFDTFANKHGEALKVLLAIDSSKFSEHEAKEHKARILSETNRRDRNADFAKLMGNEAFAAAFVKFALNVSAVNRLQIYAQDKLQQTLRAIAADCALSSIRAGNHANMMTQRLIAALDKAGNDGLTISEAPRRMHDLFSDKSMGTYSAQASSSRQVLETLGMLSIDALKKTFKLNERGQEYRRIIAC